MDTMWSSVAWKAFPQEGQQLGWLKEQVPFIPNGNALQTLDVWMPLNAVGGQAAAPSAETIPKRPGPWVVYIHGGAWRDPSINASSFAPTVSHLLANPGAMDNIGGLASLSYSLSPHPTHPENPSPPQDPKQNPDPSRVAHHPDHIQDVLAGLALLQQKAGFGSNYILIGHSCGATLAFQTAMDHAMWNAADLAVAKPQAILGLNGLYDLPNLIRDPGEKHQNLAALYKYFTQIAFGEDEKQWRIVSPKYVNHWGDTWDVGVKAVLAQSQEDTLVPYRQTEGMLANLSKSGPPNLGVEEAQINGDHNEVWQQGKRLAEVVLHMVKDLY